MSSTCDAKSCNDVAVKARVFTSGLYIPSDAFVISDNSNDVAGGLSTCTNTPITIRSAIKITPILINSFFGLIDKYNPNVNAVKAKVQFFGELLDPKSYT